jgi:hypothetical protein
MPTLEHNRLVFRFPQIEKEASFSIDFQRTLRIPDSDETYPLPPGLGSFPVQHVEDHADKLSAQTTSRGGVILPMWQAEAMWLNFSNQGPDWDLDFPVAIKVAAGKINAVTGEAWRTGLHRDPQDYMVSPEQPWLDGFAIEKGVIRQFVAMPLGDGSSVEEQVTGEAEWGGLQISVAPLKAHVWKAKRAEWEARQRLHLEALSTLDPSRLEDCCDPLLASASMGLAAGGRMRQVIHPDPFDLDDWDFAAADRVFVTLVHAKDWKKITGEAAPNEPPTAREYSQAGLPWFEYYGKDQSALPGSVKLAGVKSVANLFEEFTGAAMPSSEDVETGSPRAIGPGAKGPRPVRTTSSWDQ